jgi:uncharacterized protein
MIIENNELQYGLTPAVIAQIRGVLEHYAIIETAVMYGSRAKGNYKQGSDIDLALTGDGLTLQLLNTISLALDDLYLPYTFDLSIIAHIDNKDLLEHIHRVGVVFYKRINIK